MISTISNRQLRKSSMSRWITKYRFRPAHREKIRSVHFSLFRQHRPVAHLTFTMGKYLWLVQRKLNDRPAILTCLRHRKQANKRRDGEVGYRGGSA